MTAFIQWSITKWSLNQLSKKANQQTLKYQFYNTKCTPNKLIELANT